MIIPIDEKYRIVGTARCWQVEVMHTRKGGSEWQPRSYYRSLGMALGELARHEIRTDPAQTLAEGFDALQRVSLKYQQLLDELEIERRESRKAS